MTKEEAVKAVDAAIDRAQVSIAEAKVVLEAWAKLVEELAEPAEPLDPYDPA